MILKVDNKGAVDLFNGWGVAGRTRHIAVRLNFMRELKEAGILEVVWCSTEDNTSDIHTKNLATGPFNKHTKTYCGEDEYYM